MATCGCWRVRHGFFRRWTSHHPAAELSADGVPTVWYGREGVTVGVLAHNADENYEEGRELIERGALLP